MLGKAFRSHPTSHPVFFGWDGWESTPGRCLATSNLGRCAPADPLSPVAAGNGPGADAKKAGHGPACVVAAKAIPAKMSPRLGII